MRLELISACVVFILGILILNPAHFWMPTMMHMAILAAAVIAFSAFAVFVLRENAQDEREETHRMFAGRIAFLTGGGVLLIGVIAESIAETLDPWLVGSLLAMVMAKIGAHVYSAWYR